MDLQAHPVGDELSRIAPELLIKGGSFSRWLPHPREVPRGDRQRLLLETQQQATRGCLIDLLAAAGLPGVEPRHLASGARDWPPGYTGSVSHKGTVVATALTRIDTAKSIGIDIETRTPKGVPALPGLDSIEHPPSVSAPEGREVLFCAKEAAFKALHPILAREIDFTDVAVSWLSPVAPHMLGTARAADATLEVRCSIAVPSWIVSAALWRI